MHKAKLKEVARIQGGYAFKSSDMGTEGCPIIKIKNITPPTIDIVNVERVPYEVIETIPNVDKYKLKKGDVLIAMTGATVGKIGRFPNTTETYYLNQRVGKLVLTNHEKADYDFLYYVLSQPGCIRQIFSMADGSAQANISASQIESLEIPLPPLPEQKAIAHILGTIDDKIDLNRRMNETLEEMAKAIFKSWFVDFDPVIDNALKAGNPIPDALAEKAARRRTILENSTSGSPFPKVEGLTPTLLPEGEQIASKSPLPERDEPTSHSPLPEGEGVGVRGKEEIKDLISFARKLRKNQTDAEAFMWRLLRNRQFLGLKFRRQHPIPPYIVDFYCHELKLAIEIDGGHHNEPAQRAKDDRRTAYLQSKGIEVIRFWAHDVLKRTESVLEALYQKIMEIKEPSPPGPLSHRERGDNIFTLSPEIARLFPDSFEESPLGPIPKGWRVGKLGNLAHVTSGQRPSMVSENWSDETPIPIFGGGGVQGYTEEPLYRNPILITGRVGTLGQVFRVTYPCWPSDNTLVIIPTGNSYLHFVYQQLKRTNLENLNRGSTQPLITQKDVKNIRFIVPKDQILVVYYSYVEKFYKKIDQNNRELKILSSIRDTLLPKLISGQIRIKDAEKFVEELGL
ncbi:restriction endonuclease subunit S [Thermodesulfatator atlanticus]|uniref:restriction endonuclease subunit S n=1 Tax=Thermodesulfatator atlanticus TaxID=501497 RepID=UPI00040D8C70|nr:restriction endonuclease subunit S [Thermodesulfatator atlanticus]